MATKDKMIELWQLKAKNEKTATESLKVALRDVEAPEIPQKDQ